MDPLRWALPALIALYAVGLGWGLPASDGWDNDGVAPRDFLVAAAQTFAKGGFDFAYLHLAPVHSLLLLLLTAPVTVRALLRAPSMSAHDVVAEMIRVPNMTAIAVIARMVAVVMAVGVVVALTGIARELRGRRVAPFVAVAVGTNVALTYYAHTSDLEVPYLFWGSLALLSLVRAMVRHEPRRLRSFAALGAVAIGTKDQAAGLFLLAAPLALVTWPLDDAWVKDNRRLVLREVGIALALAGGMFLVLDEVVVNPTGFAARVRFLLGPASQDHAEYTRDWAGRLAIVEDAISNLKLFYPFFFGPLALAGLYLATREPGARRTAALVPLFAALSFTVCINFTARRTEHRFLLPQTLTVGMYAGIALDWLWYEMRGRFRPWLARAIVVLSLAWAAFLAADVDVNLLIDPRYDAEAWMREHVAPGEVIETYGLNPYLPRFPRDARVQRVDPGAVAGRDPLPGVEEVMDAFEGLPQRQPRWIAFAGGWSWRYFVNPPAGPVAGRILPRAHEATARDPASRYFRALVDGQLGYRLAYTARWQSRVWPRLDIHASTGMPVWIFARVD